jgi:fucose permease
MHSPSSALKIRSKEAGQAARAVMAIFFLDGVLIATWAALVPQIQERFQLAAGVLGLALLLVSAGSVLSLLLAGALIARLGSQQVTGYAAPLLCLALIFLVAVPSFPILIVGLLGFGLVLGGLEVAMNAQAVAVEERAGRPLMSTFHALFSTGGLVGAGIASVLLAGGLSGAAEAALVALSLAAVSLIARRSLLTSAKERVAGGPVYVAPRGRLLGLGLVALLALLSEGAMVDWSAIYLRQSLGTSASFAATGYAAFSLAMALGRFGGDWLRARFPAVRLVRLSGALAAGALGAALLLGEPHVALLGFAGIGFGLANVVPILFSAAGRAPGVPPGTGIAAVATVGYLGFIAGPPLIGFVAQAAGLPVGLGVVVLGAGLMVPLAAYAGE